MATEFLREKINTLNSLIQQFALEQYQNQLIMDDACATTGDQQVDASLRSVAQNSKVQVMICQRRIDVRKQALADLQKELDAQTAAETAVPV